ncbi:hypothetical protein B0T26DRAFT_872102 [Lasiosphaeria miniovina]|uniref:Uncharacterized protein n=1 Tax=Lasiosphaeria miniovina TaxID=1954250 RepID=A0AA40DYJ2_9PEZI|nr:uncharacterized protein B0T26DRAFT_872102 [Lasiosphaeria miniovina]KAK0717696.1 hypothetical protein B0T26DRAFT_872102 [Lasiosphaeria miniovina]
MLILYDEEDFKLGSTKKAFGDRAVLQMVYVRTDMLGSDKMKAYVKAKDGEPEPIVSGKPKHWVYNHYVPHGRIIKAIEDVIVNKMMTRAQVLAWLDSVTKALKIEPDEFLKQVQNPLTSRPAFDVWVDWAAAAICDWRENMFYGPGTGDGAGTRIDSPSGGANSAAQLARVKLGAAELKKNLPRLSLADHIPNEEFEYSADEGDEQRVAAPKGDQWWEALNKTWKAKDDKKDPNWKPGDDDE